jgi:hypothetical protein
LRKRPSPPPKVIKTDDTCTPLPPRDLVRLRNGFRSGDALGIDKFAGPSGGGKSPKHFTPLVDQNGGKKS